MKKVLEYVRLLSLLIASANVIFSWEMTFYKLFNNNEGNSVQAWVDIICDPIMSPKLCCATYCNLVFKQNKGCTAYQKLNENVCRFYFLTQDCVANKYVNQNAVIARKDLQEGNHIFMAGGYGRGMPLSTVEIFSVDNVQRKILAPLPIVLYDPILVVLMNLPLLCGGGAVNQDCWKYNFVQNSWKIMTTSTHFHDQTSGLVYQNKLYIIDNLNAEFYDPNTNLWQPWINAIGDPGHGACSVIWRDSSVTFGNLIKYPLTFNFTSNMWSYLPVEIISFDWPSCSLVANNNDFILVGDSQRFWLLDLAKMAWVTISQPSYNHGGGNILGMNGRTFLMGGFNLITNLENDVIEEFHFANRSWSTTGTKMSETKRRMRSITIPRFLF